MGLVTISDLLTQPKEMIAKYRTWAYDVGEMYDNFIKTDEENVSFEVGWHGAKARSAGIHASELSGECRRPVWYSLKGTERSDIDLDPFWKKKFRVGHVYHAMVQEDWRRMCEKSDGMLTFESEVRISPELKGMAEQYGIQSSCDGRINFHDFPGGPPVMRLGIEIKTESPDQFKDLKEPKLQHRRQTCVYMRCLDVPLMYTQYINKGTQNIVPSKPPWVFSFDFNLWNEIESEAKQVIHLATINELPPRKEGIWCEFCGYNQTCQPDALAKKAKRDVGRKRRAEQQKRIRTVGAGGIRVPKGNT
jgi:CRISPR/Cas system-associated exonuclease Cas4 (RecB family)